MNRTIHKTKHRFIAFLLIFMLVASIFPVSMNVVHADGNRSASVIFDYELISANTNYDSSGNIVVSQNSNYPELKLKLNYSITSDEPVPAGNVTFTIPVSVLKDKNDGNADTSALYEDETTPMMSQEELDAYTGDPAELTNLFVYTKSGNNYLVTNRTELSNGDPTDTTYTGSIYLRYICTLPAKYYSKTVPSDTFSPQMVVTFSSDSSYMAYPMSRRIYINPDNVKTTELFIDAHLFLTGVTSRGTNIPTSVTKLNFIDINGAQYYPTAITDADRSFFAAQGTDLHENIFRVFISSDSLTYISTDNTTVRSNVKANYTTNNAGTLTRIIGLSKVDALQTALRNEASALGMEPLSPDLQHPCLYLSAHTSALNYLCGYYSEVGEINTVGYHQYEAKKLEMTMDGEGNNKHKLPLPDTSITAHGKVYDFYSDADLNGGTGMIKKDGSVMNEWEYYYWKFNDCLNAYYKEHQQQYYDEYYPRYRDTSPDPTTIYSQSFGIPDPLYIGSTASGRNPILNKDTTYGLYGIDKSSNIDYSTGAPVNVTSINRVRVNMGGTNTISGASLPSSYYYAYQGIVSDNIGPNGEILLKTVDPENKFPDGVPSPLFNEDFLNGDNILHTAIGKVFDADFTLDRTEKTVGGQRTYIYTLAQDRRFFYNSDGTLNTLLQRQKSYNTNIAKELMPMNIIYQNKEYTNPAYSTRITIPFILPEDEEDYTMTIKGDDCVWVYLDGQMIIDLGGLNYVLSSNANYGKLNFSRDNATVWKVKTVNSYIENKTTTFTINDGRYHELEIVQIDNYSGEGCLFIETTLPFEKVTPESGDPQSSFEVQNVISSEMLTPNLADYVDELDFKNTVYIDAPHTAHEMNIYPDSHVSLYGNYNGTYYDREDYENDTGWVYTDDEAMLNRLADIDLGRNDIYATLGLIYPGTTEIESDAFQTARYQKTIVQTGENTTKNVTSLFSTSVTNYNGTGLYNNENFLLGSTANKVKHLQKYTAGTSIPSMEYPGNTYGNFAWTNKTVVHSALKTGTVRIGKEVTNSPYEFLLNGKFTFNVYYINLDSVFGVTPDGYAEYNGQPCVKETYTLKNGESIDLTVPVDVECIIEEVDIPAEYTLTSPTAPYDITVQANQTHQCTFVNEYTGIYSETTDETINIKWVDDSNRLLLRPTEDKYFIPYEAQTSTSANRGDTLIHIVYKGIDNQWHSLAEAVGSSKTNAFAQLISAAVSYDGDTTTINVQTLPKYALPVFEANAGSDVITAGTEMVYGFTQSRYGTYDVDPFDDSKGYGTLESGNTFVDTLYGSITINKTGKDSYGNVFIVGGINFDLYASEADALNRRNRLKRVQTDSNGVGVFSPIPVATYWIVEHEVAKYEPNTTPFPVTISADAAEELNVVIPVENIYAERDIVISKQVDMTYGNLPESEWKNKEFNFTVELKYLYSGTTYSYRITHADSTTTDYTFTTRTLTPQTLCEHTLTFSLKHGETLTLLKMPARAQYKVTESATPFYVPSYTVTGDAGSTIAKANDSANKTKESLSTAFEEVTKNDGTITVTFTNHYRASDYILPSSGFSDSRPMMIILFAGAAIFGSVTVFTIRRRRRVRGR